MRFHLVGDGWTVGCGWGWGWVSLGNAQYPREDRVCIIRGGQPSIARQAPVSTHCIFSGSGPAHSAFGLLHWQFVRALFFIMDVYWKHRHLDLCGRAFYIRQRLFELILTDYPTSARPAVRLQAGCTIFSTYRRATKKRLTFHNKSTKRTKQ